MRYIVARVPLIGTGFVENIWNSQGLLKDAILFPFTFPRQISVVKASTKLSRTTSSYLIGIRWMHVWITMCGQLGRGTKGGGLGHPFGKWNDLLENVGIQGWRKKCWMKVRNWEDGRDAFMNKRAQNRKGNMTGGPKVTCGAGLSVVLHGTCAGREAKSGF